MASLIARPRLRKQLGQGMAMTPKRKYLTVALALLIGIAACGGGGGSGGTNPDPTVLFSTQDPDVDQVGESKGFDLRGTASQAGATESLTGSVVLSRKPNEIFNDQEVAVSDLVLVLRFVSTGATVSSAGTTYTTLSGDLVATIDQEGVICYPDANYADIPASVRIGDAGVIGRQSCSDGTSLSSSYLVEASDRNSAWAVLRQYATYSELGEADIFEDISYHISTDGRVRAIEFVASDGALTISLSST